MANKHELIKQKVILDWSANNRGRLFSNSQFTGKSLHSDRIVKVGMGKGTSDLIGFEFIGVFIRDITPVFCAIEVKTYVSPKITPEQIDFLNYISSIGGRAYIAMEKDDGYELREWEI